MLSDTVHDRHALGLGPRSGLQVIRLRLHDEVARFDLHWLHLDAAERERAARFSQESDRMRYVAAHGSLRWLLAQRLKVSPHDIAFGTNRYGKPHLLGSSDTLCFSISHSGAWVLIALDDRGPVGVDVEAVRPGISDLTEFHRVLAPEEVVALEGLPRGERVRGFARTWVRKEAYVKALGEGMSRELRCIAISAGATGAAPRLLYDNNPTGFEVRWQFEDLEIDDAHVACVVSCSDG